jgi:pseudaminic acid biosynthesis-associated methylase
MNDNTASEAKRLEALWSGKFGNEYVDRNQSAGDVRAAFWQGLLKDHPCRRVLEIGCNIGGNLQWIAKCIPPEATYGIDVNQKALREARARIPDISVSLSPARDLPFRDRHFDLVFTMGVLIHQPDSTLPLVMSEMVRTSRKYVLCGEYFDEKGVEVPYRGETGALFKRNYGALFLDLFPELRLVKQGFLGKAEGWDDITWWLFSKAET